MAMHQVGTHDINNEINNKWTKWITNVLLFNNFKM